MQYIYVILYYLNKRGSYAKSRVPAGSLKSSTLNQQQNVYPWAGQLSNAGSLKP